MLPSLLRWFQLPRSACLASLRGFSPPCSRAVASPHLPGFLPLRNAFILPRLAFSGCWFPALPFRFPLRLERLALALVGRSFPFLAVPSAFRQLLPFGLRFALRLSAALFLRAGFALSPSSFAAVALPVARWQRPSLPFCFSIFLYVVHPSVASSSAVTSLTVLHG